MVMNNLGAQTKPTDEDHTPSLKAVVADIQTRVDDAVTRAKQTGFLTILRTGAYVAKNPFQGLAIAFGAGFLFKSLRPGLLTSLALFAGAGYLATRVSPR
jgi:ElaB/YqjD/DUF883 family membrane-anchored ribosome-binding protein